MHQLKRQLEQFPPTEQHSEEYLHCQKILEHYEQFLQIANFGGDHFYKCTKNKSVRIPYSYNDVFTFKPEINPLSKEIIPNDLQNKSNYFKSLNPFKTSQTKLYQKFQQNYQKLLSETSSSRSPLPSPETEEEHKKKINEEENMLSYFTEMIDNVTKFYINLKESDEIKTSDNTHEMITKNGTVNIEIVKNFFQEYDQFVDISKQVQQNLDTYPPNKKTNQEYKYFQQCLDNFKILQEIYEVYFENNKENAEKDGNNQEKKEKKRSELINGLFQLDSQMSNIKNDKIYAPKVLELDKIRNMKIGNKGLILDALSVDMQPDSKYYSNFIEVCEEINKQLEEEEKKERKKKEKEQTNKENSPEIPQSFHFSTSGNRQI